MRPFRETDVVVVGGGPIGLAAAIAARLAGLDVTVVERRRPPIDKPCGEGIMPDGAAILERLGVDLSARGAVPFAGIEFVENDVRAECNFWGRPGLGIRRTLLHEALLQRAERIGVELLWGREVRGLHELGVELASGPIRSRWVIGADGINSKLRRALELDVAPIHQRFGVRRHFEIRPWTDRVEVHFSNGREAYVTPVGRDLVCVAILTHDPTLGFDGALSRFPKLLERLRDVPGRTDTAGGVTVYRRTPSVVKGRVALIGDAAGSVDAITGAGITLGLHQSLILARCLRIGDLAPYDHAYRKLMRLPNGMTSFMLATKGRTWSRGLTLRTLAAAPWILSLLLALHTRSFPFSSSGGGRPAGGRISGSATAPVA